MNIAVIPAEVVKESLLMPRAIELMREAYASLTRGEVEVPLRTALINEKGTVLYKPAYSDSAGIFCAKVVSVFPDNASNGLEVCPGMIIVNSADTGMPIAVVEAGYLTSLRTGAGTGLATDLLAGKTARIGALFGTGGQSEHQLEAMVAVRNFETIYVFSRNPDNAVSFCKRNKGVAGDCQLIPNPGSGCLERM